MPWAEMRAAPAQADALDSRAAAWTGLPGAPANDPADAPL